MPPRLYVALEWSVASGCAEALSVLEGDVLVALCEHLTVAFQEAVELEGGPTGDMTVTAALLLELAKWLRVLDDKARSAIVLRVQLGVG